MEKFTESQLDRLRTDYAKIRTVGQLQLASLRGLMHQCEDAALEQLAAADIRHVSRAAAACWYQRQVKVVRA